MQPFDSGPFDSRFEDVFAPAIMKSGLEPYRVDRDPHVSIPIQEIENGIRDARICLADITLDNPNVWFELGFAIALQKDVILVCSDQRQTRFPFDVQHRSIIRYGTSAPRDFETLKVNLVSRIMALLQKENVLAAASRSSAVQRIQGLEQQEIVLLAAVGENMETTEGFASHYEIRRDMERYGFTRLAASLALKALTERGFIRQGEYQDDEANSYVGYSLTDSGWNWIEENKEQFVLKRPTSNSPDIPF
jgi:hypothetical protein